MKLDRAGGVVLSLQFQVSLMRLLGRVKATFADALAVKHDLYKPFSLVRANTKKPGFIGTGWLSHVLQITKTRHLAKVVKSIVLFVSVFMVNMPGRKASNHVKPRKPVRKTLLVVYRNRPVPHIGWTPRSFTDKIGAAVMYFPDKLAGLWVVVKNGSDMVSGNHEYEFTIGAHK